MEQKDLFGASVSRLPYVECSPNGRSAPQAPVCVKKRIKSYPTWFIKGKRYEGVMEPERIAVLSGYRGQRR